MDELIQILEEINPDIDYKTETKLIDGKIFDSFDIITIISEINEVFDIAIPAEEIIPENFNSAEAIWALVERLMED